MDSRFRGNDGLALRTSKLAFWHSLLVYFARNNVTRFHVHFTPTRASWLNRVAGFFRNLSQQ